MPSGLSVASRRVQSSRPIAHYLDDVEAPAEGPCDRCGADLAGRRYARRGAPWESRDATAWCEPCAGELIARDGVLVPAESTRLAAHALGAREWAARYAADASRVRVAPRESHAVALAGWRRELLASALVSPLDFTRAGWGRVVAGSWPLPPVWWTEPLEPLDQVQLRARRMELAAAFGVELAAVEVRP